MNVRTPWQSFDPGAIPTKAKRPELDAFLRTLPPRCRILDLGCGTGDVSRDLRERGFDVLGVDINERAIARARAGGGNYLVRNVAASGGLDLDRPPFHAVVCQLVISVVGSTSDRENLLANAWSVLGPAGRFYLSASEVSDDVNPEYERLYRQDFERTGERYSYFSRDASGNILYRTHHFTAPELAALLETAGFSVLRLESTTETSSRRADQAAHFLYAIAERSSRA